MAAMAIGVFDGIKLCEQVIKMTSLGTYLVQIGRVHLEGEDVLRNC